MLIRPHKIFDQDPRKDIKLQKPFYDLHDADYYCAEVFSSHVTGTGDEDLVIQSIISDLSLYFKLDKYGKLCGIIGIHFDDSTGAGDG